MCAVFHLASIFLDFSSDFNRYNLKYYKKRHIFRSNWAARTRSSRPSQIWTAEIPTPLLEYSPLSLSHAGLIRILISHRPTSRRHWPKFWAIATGDTCQYPMDDFAEWAAQRILEPSGLPPTNSSAQLQVGPHKSAYVAAYHGHAVCWQLNSSQNTLQRTAATCEAWGQFRHQLNLIHVTQGRRKAKSRRGSDSHKITLFLGLEQT